MGATPGWWTGIGGTGDDKLAQTALSPLAECGYQGPTSVYYGRTSVYCTQIFLAPSTKLLPLWRPKAAQEFTLPGSPRAGEGAACRPPYENGPGPAVQAKSLDL